MPPHGHTPRLSVGPQATPPLLSPPCCGAHSGLHLCVSVSVTLWVAHVLLTQSVTDRQTHRQKCGFYYIRIPSCMESNVRIKTLLFNCNDIYGYMSSEKVQIRPLATLLGDWYHCPNIVLLLCLSIGCMLLSIECLGMKHFVIFVYSWVYCLSWSLSLCRNNRNKMTARELHIQLLHEHYSCAEEAEKKNLLNTMKFCQLIWQSFGGLHCPFFMHIHLYSWYFYDLISIHYIHVFIENAL